jgi:hypothetical protein
MNNKKLALIIVSVFILSLFSMHAETKKLREVGRYRFVDVNASTPLEDLKAALESRADDLKTGFEAAGYGDVYPDFMDRLHQPQIEEKDLNIGERMMWMLFRSQGRVKLVLDLEWAGTEPLPVYSLPVVKGDRKYDFIIPKACGNVALVNVAALPREPEPPAQQEQDVNQVQKAKIYQEIYELLSESDLYCSFSIFEGDDPEIRIIDAEGAHDVRTIFSDDDRLYINQGSQHGLESGQIFQVLEIERRHRVQDENKPVYQYGALAKWKGRARVEYVADSKATVILEKSCHEVRLGDYLIPFVPKDTMMGKDLGYDVPPFVSEGPIGEVVYLEIDKKQIGSGACALINLGARDGIQVGQQLILYRVVSEDAPLFVYGNSVVVDVGEATSTIKVLSCEDPIRIGDSIMTRPAY